jgi:hypothetical protein
MRAPQTRSSAFEPSSFVDDAQAADPRRGFTGQLMSWFEVSSGHALAALVVILLLLNIAVCFPGTMMNDSVNQYAEAMSGHFTDWHPPVMAWLWSMLLKLHEGPAPMLVLHLAVFWSGIGLVADAARRLGHRRMPVLIVLAGAFPPFIFMNANVIKDVGMAASLLAGAGLVFWFRSQPRRMPWAMAALAAALLAYGMLVRTNAVFAVAPLLVYALAPAAWLRTFRLLLASVVVAVAAVPVSQQINRVAFDPVKREAVNSLLLYDIVGVAVHAGNPALVEPRATLTADDLKQCYTPFWWDSFSAWGPCGQLVRRPDAERAVHAEGLASQWLNTVRSHPLAYLQHRLKHFNSEVFFAVPLKHLRLTPEYRGELPDFKPYEVFSPSNVRFDLVRKNPAVWPVTWLAWGAVLLVILARRPPTSPVLLARVLVVSALAYSSAYLVIGVATDIRYHYWSMLASMIATLLVLPEIAAAWRARSAPLGAGFALVGLVVGVGLLARLLDFQGWIH